VVPAVRVLIVDDHRLVAEALARVLSQDRIIEVAGVAASGPQALALTRSLDPTLVLMDIGLPGMDGIDATWTLRRQHPHIPVLVLTMFDQEIYALEALRAGASGYLLKTASPGDLCAAVRAVSAGHRVLDPRVPLAALPRARGRIPGPSPLSLREIQVVQEIVGGRDVMSIASTLHLSPHTVRNHLKSAYRKLGVHSQTEAAVHALRRGLVRA
jgi:DNA-binding NarL/FixJ family response regulator